MNSPDHSSDVQEEETPVPLREPAGGTPAVITDVEQLRRVCALLADSSGPIAIDTERASGHRYWPKAYLVQIHRAGVGTILIDPVPLRNELGLLAEVLGEAEWVLHAASQDLPCLAELGLYPPRLFDTELAGRLAGYQRVALGALIETLLGYRLDKVHGAVDWSRRPLPHDWLNYAALDVELLGPLREQLETQLATTGKLEWARQEFEAVRTAAPPEPRAEPWRRTSGIHKIRTARGLAAVRALWGARDDMAQQRDRAPNRVLPDSAIINAVLADPRTSEHLRSLPVFGGKGQRRYTQFWLKHLRAAREMAAAELPALSPPSSGPPPANRWKEKNPAAAARLASARTALTSIAEHHCLPVENLVLPELVRRICWDPPADPSPQAVAEFLQEHRARPWQVELTATELSTALQVTT